MLLRHFVFAFLHSGSLSPSASSASHVPLGPVGPSRQPWGCQTVPWGHPDPGHRAATQVGGADVTSPEELVQEKGREKSEATTHTLKIILPVFLTESCLLGWLLCLFSPVWVAFHFSDVFFFSPQRSRQVF